MSLPSKSISSIERTLESKIIHQNEVSLFRQSLQKQTVIFTNGCFDILHIGHATYLYQAKKLGDFLWIGLNSDTSVKKLKGENRPIHSEHERAILLSCLYFVDAVTIFSEDTPIELLKQVKPNIHVKGGDYQAESLPEYSIIKQQGGDVKILPFVEGKSTTSIIQKMQILPK
jgi:D-glycero-beta-D-manno-heptose 1-phosphate adenylyltransferase